ncbi:hypothetical protein ABZ869_27665 [Streptomyces sp. NPDC046928]|uniref:hypothetical protein n=1 Tax=Streptomyces sp. NPDC046928 TaxID=3155021 RepID=UPI0034012205
MPYAWPTLLSGRDEVHYVRRHLPLADIHPHEVPDHGFGQVAVPALVVAVLDDGGGRRMGPAHVIDS